LAQLSHLLLVHHPIFMGLLLLFLPVHDLPKHLEIIHLFLFFIISRRVEGAHWAVVLSQKVLVFRLASGCLFL
jgi:hypothetical protein